MKSNAARDLLTARALRVPVDPVHPEFEVILQAAHIIRHGGVVAYPTETFYGLGVDPFHQKAVQRLFEIKGRSSARALILLIAHAGQAFDLARVTGLTKEWFDKVSRVFWPGPLTLVLPARARLSCPALAGGDTVAVRLSSSPVAWQFVRTLGHPVTSTSANLTGEAPATLAERIDPSLVSRIDLVLDAGPTPGGQASTILDLTAPRPAILRQGAVTADQIAKVIAIRPRLAAPPPPDVA